MAGKLRLTRGIDLHLDYKAARLAAGAINSLSLTQVPVKLWVTLEGEIDFESGMLVNVAHIERAFRGVLAAEEVKASDSREILMWAKQLIEHKFFNLRLLELWLDISDKLSIGLGGEGEKMMQLTTKYEFAASHRLWNADWDAERNFAEYGKCSNPQGHGHNYLLEITLRAKNQEGGQIADLREVERVVRERVIERFDHKYLNADTSEFAELIPTVENIAKVFWELLIGQFGRGELYRVAIWETAKTYAEYFGP